MFENYQIYLVISVVVLFFGWRYWHFKKIKINMPQLIKEGAQIIDVRSVEEFASNSNPLSKNIPLDHLSKRIKELNIEKPIIVCCASGGRSGIAARILKSNGIKNVINAGSWENTVI